MEPVYKLYVSSCGNPMLGPLSYEYWPGGVLLAFFECLLIPEMIEKTTRSRELKLMLYVGCVAFCLLYFYKNTGWGYLGVSPYVPFWK